MPSTLRFVSLALTLSLFLGGGQGEAQSLPTPDGTAVPEFTGPHLEIPQTSVTCGKIYQGAECMQSVVLKNTGTEKLVITEIRPGCGCTAAVTGKKELEPGEETTLEATVRTDHFAGQITKTVSIKTNDPVQPEMLIYISADVQVDVQVEPQRLFFGKYFKKEPLDKDVRITGTMETPLQISSVESESEFLDYSLKDAPEKDGTKILNVKFKASVPAGPFSSRLVIHTNSTRQANLDLYVNAQIVGDIETTTDRMFFAPFPPGEVRTQSLTFKDLTGKGGLQVTKYEDQGGFLDLKLEEVKAGVEYRLVATTKPDLSPEKTTEGRFFGNVLVETNHPVEKSFTVAYNGYLQVETEAVPETEKAQEPK